jgi:hypothetical protein
MTADQIAALVKQTVSGVMPQPQQPQRQYSQEEFDKMFNVYKPTTQDVADLLAGGEQAIGAIQRLLHGAVRQSTTMSSLAYQQMMEEFKQKEIEDRFGPVHADFVARQTEKVKQDFFKAYPDLKEQEELVVAIGTQLQAQGFKGTPEQAFAEVAKQAKAVLAKAGVQLAAAGGQSQQPAPTAPAPTQMATLSQPTGGAGGAPGGQQAAPKKPGLAALD